ncbi:PA3496 family putative envelope integrity protein [Marinobacterium jannaschii]|uniref:PA3496 family putative envelope integrity protein n=1 Tax=Marinobacterium jannaschii TaxID=64970 RepID=UPI0004879AD2|nr:hypothetical protein [Marinobacterium jannaschii]
MLIRKEQNLNDIQTEIFDLMVGFEDEAKINRKQHATRRALEARRAIERHYEEKELVRSVEDDWLDDLDD